MNAQEILSLIKESKNIESAYPRWKDTIKSPDCDKYHFEFNIDDRFESCGKHTMFLSTKIGWFGNSGSTRSFDIDKSHRDKFWKYFDDYCNNHIQEIMEYIANKFMKNAIDNLDILKNEAISLNEIIETLEKYKNTVN